MGMTRKEAREQAFFLVFEWQFLKGGMEELISTHKAPESLVVLNDFSCEIALLAVANLEEIDQAIDKFSDKWKRNRISKVSLAIMRVAICEMFYREDIPVSVSINEAVELAKIYAGEHDSAFINGILGTVSRTER